MPDSPPPTKLAFKIPEVAERLSVSPRSVWRLISLGELKAVRCGRSTRVSAESVEQFIARGGTK